MDWKIVSATFVSVFLAELGDKTQLATPSFAADAEDRWAVLLGSAGALVCAPPSSQCSRGAPRRRSSRPTGCSAGQGCSSLR